MVTQIQRYSESRRRYDRLVLERHYLMLAGSAFKELRRRWLRKFDRTTPFLSMERWVDADRRLREAQPDEWWRLQTEVGSLSEAYGLAPWQVMWTLFVKGFHPRDPEQSGYLFTLDAWDPVAQLVVQRGAPQLIERLITASQATGLLVELRPRMRTADDQHRIADPIETADVMVSLEIPLEYPPELAVADARKAHAVAREMLRSAGVQVAARVRNNTRTSGATATIVTHCESNTFVHVLSAACEGRPVTLVVEAGQPSIAPTSEDGKTPLALGRMRLEFSPMDKSKYITADIRRSIRDVRSVFESAGVRIGQRLRPAPLVADAQQLRVDGTRMAKRGLGDLLEDIHGFTPREESHLTAKGHTGVSRIKSRRAQINKRARKKGLLPP